MARKRISMKKIRDIIRLKETSDLSERKIAKALNISRPVVAQYISDFRSCGLTYEQAKTIPDSQLLELLEKRKSKKSAKYEELIERFPRFIQELKRTGVTLMTLWNEYQQENPDGYSYSPVSYTHLTLPTTPYV